MPDTDNKAHVFLSAFFTLYCFLLTYSCIDYLSFHFFSMSPTDVVRNWEGFFWKIAVKLKAYYEFMTSPKATHHWEQDFSISLIEIMLIWSTLCIKPQIKSKVNEINPDLKF